MAKKETLESKKALIPTDSKDENFSKIVDLFKAIEVSEKGIEDVYKYLLNNKIIEDPKTVTDKLNYSLKRVYKIFSVLKELGLIQIYDRPMKIVINPPLKSWETLISNKIKEFQENTNKRIKKCENCFQKMIEAYHIAPEIPQLPPVEFVAYANEDNPFDFILTELASEHECLIARGIPFENPIFLNFQNSLEKGHKEALQIILQNFNEWTQKLPRIRYRILISEDFVNDIMSRLQPILDEFPELQQIPANLGFDLEFKVINKAFGNFIVQDNGNLIQFSIDPKNILIGIFVSRQKEINQIFREKFEDLCKNAENLSEYLQRTNVQLNLINLVGLLLF